MATQGGQLLLNRMNLTLAAGNTLVDTGLRQPSLAMAPDPPLGGVPLVTASRVMVIPCPPLAAWHNIGHTEPVLNVGGTVELTFTNFGDDPLEFNVLFWSPHTSCGPVSADPYGVMEPPPPDCDLFEGCFALSASVSSNGVS